MNLLRILAILGRGDQAVSEGMYEVLADAMKRADTGINVGYAIGESYSTFSVDTGSSLMFSVKCVVCVCVCVLHSVRGGADGH